MKGRRWPLGLLWSGVQKLGEAWHRHLERHGWWRANARLMVAVSGGMDSMCLLHLIVHERITYGHGWGVEVVHVNHQLRGRESEGDARFVRKWCESHGVTCHLVSVNVKELMSRRKISMEMAAREVRYGVMGDLARAGKFTHVLTAHHADDQIETFFLRLLRGTGNEGLAGIKEETEFPGRKGLALVRPLLSWSRSDLAAYARENKIAYRKDASNESLEPLRNRVRLKVLPCLKKWLGCGWEKTIPRWMLLAEADAECLSDAARAWLEDPGQATFEELPVAMQRYVLRAEFSRLGVNSTFEMVEALREEPGRIWEGSARVRLVRTTEGRLKKVAKAPAKSKLAVKARRMDWSGEWGARAEGKWGGLAWKWRVAAKSDLGSWKEKPEGCEYLDADKVMECGRGTLRTWKAGDRFWGLGMPRPSKLQDWFVNEKVPRAERGSRGILVDGEGDILWVEGLRVGEKAKLTSSTRRVLVWEARRLG